MQIPTPPTPTSALRHGAVALMNAAALVQARRVLDGPGASDDQIRDAARTLAEKGSNSDRLRGAAILAGGPIAGEPS